MKEIMLPAVAAAALCLSACERGDRDDQTDRTDADRANVNEPRSGQAVPSGSHDEAGRDAPRTVETPRNADDPGSLADRASQTRAEYVAASRRRLDELERELQQLETRSRERGKEMRGEIREEKRRLDRELEQMNEKSDEAWTQMKGGFADALERLEGQIREVRKDIDPDA